MNVKPGLYDNRLLCVSTLHIFRIAKLPRLDGIYSIYLMYVSSLNTESFRLG